MADITYADKIAGSTFSHEDANEIKTAVNTKVDKETGKVLSDNNYDDAAVQKVADSQTASQVTTAINAAVAGLYDDRGNYDASGNTFPASGGSGTAGAILKGDIWTISVAGTLGSTAVNQGDTVRALQDTPGQTEGNWAIVESGLTPAQLTALTSATVPAAAALTGEILLDRVNGRQYNTYDMASGALTFSIGASPTLFGCASGIIISDATITPVVSAFAGVFGTYDNTNNVENHWFVIYKYNASNALVAYLTWSQTA